MRPTPTVAHSAFASILEKSCFEKEYIRNTSKYVMQWKWAYFLSQPHSKHFVCPTEENAFWNLCAHPWHCPHSELYLGNCGESQRRTKYLMLPSLTSIFYHYYLCTSKYSYVSCFIHVKNFQVLYENRIISLCGMSLNLAK